MLDGKPTPSTWGPLSGLHKTSDGHVRVHDSFPNHAKGILDLAGLPHSANREQLSEKLAQWASIDVETTGMVEGKLAVYALRTYGQWDALPQSHAINTFPIDIKPLPLRYSERGSESSNNGVGFPPHMTTIGPNDKCLRGLRVVELSRVIAAPLCGKTLAAHGADVIWVTSPTLPSLPNLDYDLGRGKRTVALDLKNGDDKNKLLELLRTADVFVQGFRPGALANEPYGLSTEKLLEINPQLIVANLSAWGPRGPWKGRRGFDSLVQTATGMNASEAEHAGQGEPAKAMPCQALDHAAGYMLAAAIMAAVYKRATTVPSERRGWQIDVSLAGQMRYLRSLGQYPGDSGFVGVRDYRKPEDVPPEFLETKALGLVRWWPSSTRQRRSSWLGCHAKTVGVRQS